MEPLIKHLLKTSDSLMPQEEINEARIDTAIINLQEFREELVSECDYSPEQVAKMDGYELLNARLEWEGIHGFTPDIIQWVNKALGLGIGLDEIDDEPLANLGI